MYHDRNKGKIIINIENENGKINSKMIHRGIAKISEVALTTLLVNFVSLSLEKGKDPEELISKHLPEIITLLKQGKKL